MKINEEENFLGVNINIQNFFLIIFEKKSLNIKQKSSGSH